MMTFEREMYTHTGNCHLITVTMWRHFEYLEYTAHLTDWVTKKPFKDVTDHVGAFYPREVSDWVSYFLSMENK